jgi:hypothetical protein
MDSEEQTRVLHLLDDGSPETANVGERLAYGFRRFEPATSPQVALCLR